MTKKVFDQIAEGLNEALATARSQHWPSTFGGGGCSDPQMRLEIDKHGNVSVAYACVEAIKVNGGIIFSTKDGGRICVYLDEDSLRMLRALIDSHIENVVANSPKVVPVE